MKNTEYLLNLSLLMIYNEGDITTMCINTNSIQLLISVQIILFLINFPSCEHLWKAFNTLKYTPLQLLFNSILTIGNTKQISVHYFLRLGASGAYSKMSEIYQTVVMSAIYFTARDANRINKLIEKLARIWGRWSR